MNQAFKPENGENSGGGRISRRTFIKRTGGATLATILAWNITAQRARAEAVSYQGSCSRGELGSWGYYGLKTISPPHANADEWPLVKSDEWEGGGYWWWITALVDIDPGAPYGEHTCTPQFDIIHRVRDVTLYNNSFPPGTSGRDAADQVIAYWDMLTAEAEMQMDDQKTPKAKVKLKENKGSQKGSVKRYLNEKYVAEIEIEDPASDTIWIEFEQCYKVHSRLSAWKVNPSGDPAPWDIEINLSSIHCIKACAKADGF